MPKYIKLSDVTDAIEGMQKQFEHSDETTFALRWLYERITCLPYENITVVRAPEPNFCGWVQDKDGNLISIDEAIMGEEGWEEIQK